MINIATYGQLSQQNHLLKFSRYLWLSQGVGERSELRVQGFGSIHYKNPTPETGASCICNALGVLAFPGVDPRSWPATGPVLQCVSSSAAAFHFRGARGAGAVPGLSAAHFTNQEQALLRSALQNNGARCQQAPNEEILYALVRPGQCGSAECQGWHFAQRGSYISGSTQTLRHFCTRVSTLLCCCPSLQWFYLLCLYFSISSDHCPSKSM